MHSLQTIVLKNQAMVAHDARQVNHTAENEAWSQERLDREVLNREFDIDTLRTEFEQDLMEED